ncbi:MAG TPA: alpha/beta fold hydrolase [Rhizomicrobium sp.]
MVHIDDRNLPSPARGWAGTRARWRRIWPRASRTFRLDFHRQAPQVRKQLLSDIRWAFEAADPAAPVRCGSFAASDHAKLPYRLWLPPHPKAILLLLHGAFDYSGAFDEIGPKIAAQGMAAFAYDQRGFGATNSRRHWCGRKRLVEDVGDAVAYLRARFGALPVFIVGESMGAAVAVHAAATNEDLDVAGIVLAAPGAVAGSIRRLLASLFVGVLNFFAPRSEITVERLSASELVPAAAIRLLFDPLVLRAVRPNMAFGLLELATTAVDEARNVTLPTLTMVGSREKFLNVNCIAQLHRLLAGEKSWCNFEGGPHLLLHWVRRDEVLDKVFSWLDARIARVQQPQH